MQTYLKFLFTENQGLADIQVSAHIVYFATEMHVFNIYRPDHLKRFSAFIIGLTVMASCQSDQKNKATGPEKEKPVVILKKDSVSKEPPSPRQVPVINITDTIAVKYTLIVIKDSAANSLRLSQKLAQIYGVKLADIVRKNKLTVSGPPHAWFKSQKAPFFFEAGIPVDKKPAKAIKGVSVRQIGGDSAVVAHYYGPYEQSAMAYEALHEWLKDRKKKLRGAPYEVYIGDPIDKDGKPVDPYKVLTDIVFPRN